MEAGKKEALKRARALREKFRSRGEFTTEEFRAELAAELEDLRGNAFGVFVESIAQTVDRDEARVSADDRQQHLFEMDGEYRLGDTRRIAKRLARIEHADASMAINDADLAARMVSNARQREELSRLRPYWGAGVTKEEAVAAYHAANSEEAA